MIYLIKYVFQIKQNISTFFNVITGIINKLKTLQSIFHGSGNGNLMGQNVSQFIGGITINLYVSVKNIISEQILCL